MVAVSDTAGTSAPVLGVRPSGDHTQKMSAMHDQLKSLHFRSWLSLLDDAGDESTLFRDTSLSQLSSEHRLKAIAPLCSIYNGCVSANVVSMASLRLMPRHVTVCPTLMLVSDFLHVHSTSSAQELATGYLNCIDMGCQACWFSQSFGDVATPTA